jgi:hypothetical protein
MDMGCRPDYYSDDTSMVQDLEGRDYNLGLKVGTFHC